ncbi:MAG: ABC transporter ATP-binding protein [Acidimicrobiales bacterium]
MTAVAIELVDVTKDFVLRTRAGRLRRERRIVRAVDSISLTVEAGEMVGLIGPNGAGKSTTIKMLTGILVPTAGQVRVAGLDPQRHRIATARRVGVVFGQRTQLWWDLPLADSFDLLRHVYRVPADRHRTNLAGFIDLLDLGEFLATPVRQLSLGQRMRGEITAALLHDPSVLYLDEPTIGLDVVSKQRVRDFLTQVNVERGVTVVLTTHDLDDVERLCPRLVVVDHGRIVHDGTVDDVRARYAPYRTLVVDLATPGALPPLPRATLVRSDGPRHWIRFRRDTATAAEVVADVAALADIRDLTVEEPDIEEVIRAMYADSSRPVLECAERGL